MKLEDFLKEYFDLIKRVNSFHWQFLTENKFIFPKNSYIELKKFIDTATNFLSDIDDKILQGLTGKLYSDVDSLYEFYIKFLKETKYIEAIFYKNYLDLLDEYQVVKKNVKKLQNKIEEYTELITTSEEKLEHISENDPKYKKLKRIYVDAIHELSNYQDEFYKNKKKMIEIEKREEGIFFSEFKKLRDFNLKKLEKIINSKLFYFDKLLWVNAQKSKDIVQFFKTSNIEGEFSTKTFIQYFLRNIDEAKSNKSEWISYLKQMLKVIE